MHIGQLIQRIIVTGKHGVDILDHSSKPRLTEKAKYHFDAEMCTSIAEAVELAHANTRRGLLVCGGEAAALEAAELLVNN